MPVSAQELLRMQYSQRRIIVVRDDAHATMKSHQHTAPAGRGRASFRMSDRPIVRAGRRYIYFVPYVGLAFLAADIVKARREMRQGGENLIPISSADAAELQFPVGHPREMVAYIGHPVDPPVYIPVADFHRFLFEHKVAEALRLIRSLGAVTVEVVRVEGWDQTIGVELGVALPDASQTDIGASAGRERSSGRSVLSTMRLKPTHSPSIPADLVWLPHEPLWQEVAQARLESGLDSFVLDVRSTDDYGVNARLKALVAKAGLEAGGAFVEHRNTVWRLQGAFS
jgi:hypothetical protein